ncbi:MAG: DUF494 domain-containing protein [Rhodoferax sp.]|nr:DUF494 domain-containing protein [Rhodoferax sp.]
MFDVLAFVYHHFNTLGPRPEPARLQRTLCSAGFDFQSVTQAMEWLCGLDGTTLYPATAPPLAGTLPKGTREHGPSALSTRAYADAEQALGVACLDYLIFLERAGMVPPALREVVLDRALAVGQFPLSVDNLKLVILVVLKALGHTPDTWLLDELCDDGLCRTWH